MIKANNRLLTRGFTLVEIVVVISVVAILTSIGIVSYTGYRSSVISTQLKSDLSGVATAMEDAKNFNDTYPLTIPSNFTASADTDLAVAFADGASYCIDATTVKDTNIQYFIDNTTSNVGAQEGSCGSRPGMGGATCADTDKYGEYPNCYDYDALPIATSISGYWTTAPAGYLLEDGSAVSCIAYADLYDALYPTGTCSTTFNVPDSRGRVTVNRNTSDVDFDEVGEKPGSKTQTISIAQMFSHNHFGGSFSTTTHGHGLSGNTSSINYPDGRDSYDSNNEQDVADPNHIHYFSGWTTVPSASAGINAQGSGAAHNNIQPSIVKNYAIKYSPSTGNYSMLPASTSISGYFTSAPAGYLLEDGSAVSRTTYADLYTALGGASSPYGQGDGTTTFNVPDSRGRVAVNISADTEFDSMGEKYGEKSHAMTETQMPSHNHSSSFATNNHQHSYSGTTGVYNHPDGTDAFDETNEQEGANRGHVHTFSGWTGVTDHGTESVSYQGSSQAHNEIQPSIVKTFAIKYTPAEGEVDTLPKGTSVSGYFTSAPAGYLLEDGSAVSRTTYADLYTALGAELSPYGQGDGSTTFNLPNSRGRVMVNKSPYDSEFDSVGEISGAKTVTLAIADLPSHNHGNTFASAGHTHYYSFWTNGPNDSKNRVDSTNDQDGANMSHIHPVTGTSSGPNATASVSSQGGSQAHNNIQPSIVQNFAIKY